MGFGAWGVRSRVYFFGFRVGYSWAVLGSGLCECILYQIVLLLPTSFADVELAVRIWGVGGWVLRGRMYGLSFLPLGLIS